MEGRTFLQAVIAGLIATFVMTMSGFWISGIGLPRAYVGRLLAQSSGHSWARGNLAHFVNGAILGLIYVQWLERPLR